MGFKTWAENASLHGIQHAILTRTGRTYFARKVWGLIFATSFIFCIYLQTKLIIDILINKPTTVDLIYERSTSANFPNVVICDLNQEMDRGTTAIDPILGNTSLITLLTFEISMNELFEPLRRELRRNLSVLQNYDFLNQLFKDLYDRSDPEYAKMLRESSSLLNLKTEISLKNRTI